jgi:hypothetical protein
MINKRYNNAIALVQQAEAQLECSLLNGSLSNGSLSNGSLSNGSLSNGSLSNGSTQPQDIETKIKEYIQSDNPNVEMLNNILGKGCGQQVQLPQINEFPTGGDDLEKLKETYGLTSEMASNMFEDFQLDSVSIANSVTPIENIPINDVPVPVPIKNLLIAKIHTASIQDLSLPNLDEATIKRLICLLSTNISFKTGDSAKNQQNKQYLENAIRLLMQRQPQPPQQPGGSEPITAKLLRMTKNDLTKYLEYISHKNVTGQYTKQQLVDMIILVHRNKNKRKLKQ